MNIICNFHAIPHATQFIEILDILSKKFSFVDAHTIEKFYDKELNLDKVCHITFDDGHISFYEKVIDILNKKGIPCSLFVSPQRILKEKNFWFQNYEKVNQEKLLEVISLKYDIRLNILKAFNLLDVLSVLSITEIESLIKKSFELSDEYEPEYTNITKSMLLEISKYEFIKLGAHTINHPILSNESDNDSQKEIGESVSLLSELIGKEISSFAYPNGRKGNDYGDRELNFLNNSNIKLAFTTNPDHFSLKYGRYEIPRVGLTIGATKKLIYKILFPKQFEALKNMFKYSENEIITRKRIRYLLEKKYE